MYQALYRKYRPSTFDDVCGQEHITSVLKMQLQKGRVSHAYLFCGSRGTGKTTCAKILAKAVNCENPINGEPCNQCDACRAINEERLLDVVEMDAASNNGVDHIRRLCDEVQFLPSEAKKRVYIVDEVHMLSNSAFNALLKTIEEPPSHVLFILATTEVNAIPATILSRCQRFDFKRITPEIVSARLMMIAEKEGIALCDDAARIIARLSDGAMRDALSLLEACQGYEGEINGEKIQSILGLGSRESVIRLCSAIASQDTSLCLRLTDEMYADLSDFKEVISDLIAIYRDLLVIRSIRDYAAFVESYGSELEQLEKIASLLSLETILYQAKLLEEFYISYDRIATGKKSASEILMIRLCNESVSEEPSALLSRIGKLEQAMAKGTFTPKAEQQEAKVETVKEEPATVKSSQPILASKQEAVKEEGKAFSGTVKLKNLLQQEAFIKPWLEMLSFEKEGDTLYLICGSFVQGMLVSSGAEESLLRYVREVDGEITKVRFREVEAGSVKNSPSEFEGL